MPPTLFGVAGVHGGGKLLPSGDTPARWAAIPPKKKKKKVE